MSFQLVKTWQSCSSS